MSTAPDELDELLRGVPPAPPRAPAAAPVRRERDELDVLLEETPAASSTGLRVRRSSSASPARVVSPAAAPAAMSATSSDGLRVRRPSTTSASTTSSVGVDPRLDSFVNDVIGEASRRSGYTYRLGEGVRTPAQQAEKVAGGVSWTYNSRHLHGRGRDVLAFDGKGNYLTDGAHPAYATLGEVYQERAVASPVRVRWGVVRNGKQADPGHFELEDDDALDALLAEMPAADGTQPPQQGDELDALLAGLPDDADEPVERVNISIPASRAGARPSGLNVRRPPASMNPYSQEDRTRRDAAAASRVVALTFKPPRPLADYTDASDFMRDAYLEAARARNVSPEFAENWLKEHPEVLRLVRRDTPTAQAAVPTDLIGTSAYDSDRQTARLELERVGEMARDYEAHRSTGARVADFFTDPTTTAGEKAVAGVGMALRPIGALSTGVAGLQRSVSTSIGSLAGDKESQKIMDAEIYSPVNIVKATWERFKTGKVPDGFEQPIAQGLDLLYQKKNKMPLPAWRRMALEIIGDPMSYASLNLVGTGARALKGTRAGQRLSELRGLTVLDIERAADDGGGYLVKLQDADGAVHVVGAGGRPAASTKDDLDKLIADIPDDPAATEFIPVNSGAASTPAAVPASSSGVGLRVRRAGRAVVDSRAGRAVAGVANSPAARTVQDVVNLPKAIRASFDLSGLGAQGGIIAGARPSLIPGAVADSTRSVLSKEAHEAFKRGLLSSPNQELRESSGLYLASIGQGEETFASRFAEKIPGVAASQRGFEASLDSFRAHAFDLYAERLTKAGVTDPKAFKDIARWVNVATGRGELGKLEPLANVLNLPLFSPRLLASKFNVLSPLRYARMHPEARKIALVEMFRASGSLGVTMGLATLAGATVDLNPFSGGFGTIKSGETSYDLSGGRIRTLRYASQIADSFAKRIRGEHVKDERLPVALVEKFFRAYLSPVGALAYDVHTGEDFDGQPFEWTTAELVHRLSPIAAVEMYDAYQKAGTLGALKTTPAFVGVGVTTREKKPEAIKPVLSATNQAELDRLGLDLEHLGKNGKRSLSVNPRKSTRSVTGDSIEPFGGDDRNSGVGMPAEETAKELSAELDEALADEINSPDYESMSHDDRAQRLEVVMLNIERRVMNGVRRDARGLQMEDEKRVKERLDRMSGGSAAPVIKNFKL